MKKDLKSLYETLVKQGLTDKNFDQFKSAAEDEAYRNKVYDVLIDRQLYEGERESFNDTYFFEYTPADVKKKTELDGTSQEESMVSTSDPALESGLSLSLIHISEPTRPY